MRAEHVVGDEVESVDVATGEDSISRPPCPPEG